MKTASEVHPAAVSIVSAVPDANLAAELGEVLSSSPELTSPSELAFVRTAMSADVQNPMAVPAWARGMKVHQTHGPFLDVAIAEPNIATGAANSVSVLLGNGNGSFGAAVDTEIGVTLSVLPLYTADFDNDGKTDLAAVVYDSNNYQYSLRVLIARGDGTFALGQSYVFTLPFNNTTISWLAIRDFNRDGKTDIAVLYGVGSHVAVLIGNGDGSFQSPVTYTPGGEVLLIAAGDVNGDGKLDLVAAHDAGTSVLLGNGDGTFQSHIDSLLPRFTSTVLYSISVQDLNADGKPDLATNSGAGVVVLLGNGDGTFRLGPHYVGANSMVAGDFNSDGTPDLAVSTSTVTPLSIVPAIGLLLSSPMPSFSPSPLSFGSQAVNLSSGARPLMLTNVGNGPLSISSIITAGDFAETGNCDNPVAIGANCSLNVSFTPATSGSRKGSVIVVNNAITTPQVIGLTGTGVVPTIKLSPTTLNFGYHQVGSASLPQTITLTNTSNAAVSIASVSASAGFSATSNCGTIVAAGATCVLTVGFAPQGQGIATGTLTITDDANGSPQSVSLTGIGSSSSVFVSPASSSMLDFGAQTVGSASAPQSITIANATNRPLNILRILVLPPAWFSQSNTCSRVLSPGSSCTIQITFNPTSAGKRFGFAFIIDSARPVLQRFELTGQGVSRSASLRATGN